MTSRTPAPEVPYPMLALPLPGGRTLYVALTMPADGSPADLTIGAARPGDTVARALSEGACLPADALPVLRDALTDRARQE